MTKNLLLRAALLLSIGLGLSASDARAAFIGSFGLNGNVPSANPTSSLATATNFTFANLATNGNSSGGFAGLPLLTVFNTTTLTLGATSGFTFSNATFGTFTQTEAALMTAMGVVDGVVTSKAFLIVGTYAGGAVGNVATPASFTISFTQNGGPGSSVSASGTLDIPPLNAVPEPASLAMLGLGLASVGGVALRRRSAK